MYFSISHDASLGVQAIEAFRPSAYIDVAKLIFCVRFGCNGFSEWVFLAIALDDCCVFGGIVVKRFLLWQVASHTAICAYPYLAIVGSEEAVDDALVGARQVVGGEFACLLVHAHESISCSYPEHVIIAFCHAEHIVAWQNVGCRGIAPVVLETIAIV